MTRQEIALGELRALSVSIGVKWVKHGGGVLGTGWVGNAPTHATLDEIAGLTTLYAQARKFYDKGDHLACIAVLTAEDKK